MKFSCERALLLSAINSVSRIVPSRSSIAALEGILIEAGTRLRLTGFNLEIGIRAELDVDVSAPGTVVVGARLLGEIVRKLPDDTVTFELKEKMVLTITCGHAVFDIASCLDGASYPEMPSVSEEQGASLPQAVLKGMIQGTLFAVSDNESKIVHTGSQFNWSDNELVVVSVDGYRLALRREKAEGGVPDSFVVPGSALREVERLLTDREDSDVSLSLGGRHISFVMGDTVLVTRLLEGEFLNYRTAVPANLPISVSLDTAEFIAGLERVSLLVSEKIKNPVRLRIRKDGLSMTCTTSLGRAGDECAAGVSGELPCEEMEIGFNHRYLLDALRALPNGVCTLRLAGPLSPCVLEPEEGDGHLHMVLPVRLRVE